MGLRASGRLGLVDVRRPLADFIVDPLLPAPSVGELLCVLERTGELLAATARTGGVACIGLRLADQRSLEMGADASRGRPFPLSSGERQPPLLRVAVGGPVAAVGIAGMPAVEEPLVALLEPQLMLGAGVQRAPGGLVCRVL
jgi:hypothetical protein